MMNQVIDNIIPISWVMLTLGWIIHSQALMRHVEKKRQQPTSLLWFIKNRRRKFIAMVITPIPLGFIEYVVVHPPTLDITPLQGRMILGGYFVAILLTGAGSNQVIDKFGGKAVLDKIDDDEDSYKTQFIGKK